MNFLPSRSEDSGDDCLTKTRDPSEGHVPYEDIYPTIMKIAKAIIPKATITKAARAGSMRVMKTKITKVIVKSINHESKESDE